MPCRKKGSRRSGKEGVVAKAGPFQQQVAARTEKAPEHFDTAMQRAAPQETPASELPTGTEAAYWLSLRGYHPERVAKDLRRPMLILQGGRDYQVTMADFDGWKKTRRPLAEEASSRAR